MQTPVCCSEVSCLQPSCCTDVLALVRQEVSTTLLPFFYFSKEINRGIFAIPGQFFDFVKAVHVQSDWVSMFTIYFWKSNSVSDLYYPEDCSNDCCLIEERSLVKMG
jgi:hypothetical protein